MALDTMSAQFNFGFNVSGGKNLTGYPSGQANSVTWQETFKFLKTLANSAAFGCDELILGYASIAASGHTDIDLTSLTDIAGVSGITLSGGKVKAYLFALLSAAQTAPDGSTVGNGCSGISLGNSGANDYKLNLDVGTDLLNVNNGGLLFYADGSAAGMSAVDATHKIIRVLNNDGAIAAKVVYMLAGCTN